MDVKHLPPKTKVCIECENGKTIPATVEPKVPVYKSKTVWTVVIYWFVVKQFPASREWIDSHGEDWDMLVGAFLIVLRHVTAGRIKWKFWEKEAE